MAENGKVISIDENKGLVSVSLTRSGACAGCRACRVGDVENEMIMEARNLCGAKAGDFVEVELRDGSLLRAALILYGVPLAALFIGAIAGGFLFRGSANRDVYALLCGLAMTGLAYLTIKATDKKRDQSRYAPMAVKITADNHDNP